MTKGGSIAQILRRVDQLKWLMFEQNMNDFKRALSGVFEFFQKDIDRISQVQRVIENILKKRHDTKFKITP